MLRVAVLTTDTAHHRYFLDWVSTECASFAEICAVIVETRRYPWRRNAWRHFRRNVPNLLECVVYNPYFFHSAYAAEQDRFEEYAFCAGDRSKQSMWDRAVVVNDANESCIHELLGKVRPDVIFVYGTGKLGPEVFRKSGIITVNAHGGRLPRYRGLDTNLWAALENRTEDICVTLHEMDENLDTGRVLVERAVLPDPAMCVASLRYFTTLTCCALFADLMATLATAGPVYLPPRKEMSRYYGPMPALYKRQADRVLRAWGKMALEGRS